MLNEVPATVEHVFGPSAVQWKSQAPPDLLEEDGLANLMADVIELEMHIVELRGDRVNFLLTAPICKSEPKPNQNGFDKNYSDVEQPPRTP